MSRRRDTQLSRPHRGHKFVRDSSRSLDRVPLRTVTGGMGLATGALCTSVLLVRCRRTGNRGRRVDRTGAVMYEKPAVKRFGSLRELTEGAGPAGGGDATSIYHRS